MCCVLCILCIMNVLYSKYNECVILDIISNAESYTVDILVLDKEADNRIMPYENGDHVYDAFQEDNLTALFSFQKEEVDKVLSIASKFRVPLSTLHVQLGHLAVRHSRATGLLVLLPLL